MVNKVDEILTALKNDVLLFGLVSGRVYWIKPAGTQKQPYITIIEATNDESQAADDGEYSDDVEIQIDMWTPASTIPIAKEVQRVMRSMGWTHQAMPDTFDENIQMFHKSLRFFITVEI